MDEFIRGFSIRYLGVLFTDIVLVNETRIGVNGKLEYEGKL